MKFKLILFDADGTLFDFDKAEKEAFNKTMHFFGIDHNPEILHQKYDKVNKAIWREFEQNLIGAAQLRVERFRRFFRQSGIDLDPQEVSPCYLKFLSQGTYLMPEAEEIVRYCAGKAVLALATNGLTDVQRPRFENSIISQYFSHLFISEEIGFPKPGREFFDHIFQHYPFRDSAIIVGDNLSSDIQGGNDAGIVTCWFNPQQQKNTGNIVPTYEIQTLTEIKVIIN